MPVFNSKETTKDAVEAILKNTQTEYELLLIDGNSKDGTQILVDEYAEKYEHIRSVHIEPKGLVNAFNYGLTHTEGDVYLTHDDVIIHQLYKRCWLNELKQASKIKNMGMITTLQAGGTDTAGDYLLNFKWVGTWSMYIPRTTINKVGLLDEKMRCGDDIDYCYRIYKSGLNISVCNFWVEHHRTGYHVENQEDFSKLVKKMSKYFRSKHKL